MIRFAKETEDELNQMMAIWLESTIKAHPFVSETFWKDHYNIVKSVYMPKSENYVYLDKDEVVGFICIVDGDYIGALFVALSHQRQGIGRALIQYALNAYDTLSLAVYKENKGAVDFYRQMGFNILCERIDQETGAMEYLMEYGVEKPGM